MPNNLLLERFWWFDNRVREGRYPNAARLAERFEISPKTAQRNIDLMRDRFRAPLEYDPVRRGYKYTDDSFSLPPLRMTEQELSALLISRQLLTSLAQTSLGKDLASILDKLQTVLAGRMDNYREQGDRFSFELIEYSPTDGDMFQKVAEALLKSRQLEITYYSPQSDSVTRRMVEPCHLMNYMGNWHVAAFCHLRGELRDFVLGRIREARLLDRKFNPLPPAEIAQWLSRSFGIFKGEGKTQVVIRFNPFRARWVRSQCWHRDQQITEEPDGSVVLSLPVSHFAEIMMEVLKFGADAEVLEPMELREEVRREIEKMRKIY